MRRDVHELTAEVDDRLSRLEARIDRLPGVQHYYFAFMLLFVASYLFFAGLIVFLKWH